METIYKELEKSYNLMTENGHTFDHMIALQAVEEAMSKMSVVELVTIFNKD
jgi:hypothetical protein